jgi:hypothetical protein
MSKDDAMAKYVAKVAELTAWFHCYDFKTKT